MSLLSVQIVAPDSAHWADWIDGALSPDRDRQDMARSFHQRLLDQGKIPFLSWHHLEELLCIESDENARRRVAFLQSLPLIAWMRAPGDEAGLGGITDILASEAIAADQGSDAPSDVRDAVRQRLMRTGTAEEAIGSEAWVWEAVRPALLARRPHIGMVAALGGFRVTDDSQTVAQIAAQQLRTPEDRDRMLAAIHAKVFREALATDSRRSQEEALAMANAFITRVIAMAPADGISVRELVTSKYVAQGVDPDEIRDESLLSELSDLGTFRSHLRVVAENTGLSFDRLKRVKMNRLPSWLITNALRRFGQERVARPGSDVHDEHLAVLAAYTDQVFVDKRTHEDFRRVLQKAPDIASLVGTISKASRYGDITEVADS